MQLYETMQMVKDVKGNAGDWGGTLMATMDAMFQRIQSELASDASRPLQVKIKSVTKPGDDDAHVNFNRLQTDQTVQRYMRHGRELMAFMIRRVVDLPLDPNPFPPMDPNLTRAIRVLHGLLTDEGVAQAVREMAMKEVWWAMWLSTDSITRGIDRFDPPFLFVAITTWRQDGGYRAANDVSGTMAAIFYWSKVVLYDRMKQEMAEMRGRSDVELEAALEPLLTHFRDTACNAYGAFRQGYHLVRHVANRGVNGLTI